MIERPKATQPPTMNLMFPGFTFAAFDPDADSWRPIAHTTGVRRIIGTSPLDPTPVRDDTMAALACADPLDLTNDEQRLDPLKPGDFVRVTAGKMVNYTGTCKWSLADRSAIVIDLVFGRRTLILDRNNLELA